MSGNTNNMHQWSPVAFKKLIFFLKFEMLPLFIIVVFFYLS